MKKWIKIIYMLIDLDSNCESQIKLQTMFMRYYPKDIKPIERLAVSPRDRGKRHYWGYQKGDYGIYQSHDPQYMQIQNSRSEEKPKLSHHRRGLSSDVTNNFVYERMSQQYSTVKKGLKGTIQNQKERKVLKISNPIEIHLPSIQRTTRQTQTKEQQNPQQDAQKIGNKQSLKSILKKQKYQAKDIKATIRAKKCYTQAQLKDENYRNQTSTNNRYNPSFVCSIQNPLPTYFMEPHVYHTLTYSRNGSYPQGNLLFK